MRVPSLFRVLVPVSDIEAATAFYRAITTLDGERVSPGRHYFELGPIVVACFDAAADGDHVDSRPLSDPLYLACDDLAQMRAALLAAGGVPTEGDVGGAPAGEIAERPWAERSFYAHDPFANPLCFVARGTEFRGR